MTSQKWYDEKLTNKPIWDHYVVVHIPNTIRYPDAAFMFISSGSNPGPPGNTTHIFRTGQYANITGIVTATLVYIPNQPLIMENDGIQRVEDEIIAWTWRRFYNESHVGIDNPEILLYMPMCKASVRAMDTIQEYIRQENGNNITKFMISGESKRGWTTWLTGAIDSRVVAMAPVVLSCLNMNPNFHHYWRALGAWSMALYDYWMQGIMGLIDEPEIAAMAKIIDPYQYRQWMTMPKLMISGASDEFFFPDDYDYFYNDLLGEKYIWIIENSGHSVGSSPSVNDYWDMLQTFYIGVLQNYRIPQLTWSRETNATGGSISLFSPVAPVSISAWSAPSIVPERRDFRLHALDADGNESPTNIVWTEKAVTSLNNGVYTVDYENPATGYLAFFIKVNLPGPEGRVYHLTSEANIIPATYPFPDCSGSGCYGTLV
jgi:PhoPQ-activated pathogenicity-related protein